MIKMMVKTTRTMAQMYFYEVCVCVCVTKNEHFPLHELSARGAKRGSWQALPAIARIWPCDDDDEEGDKEDDEQDGADGRPTIQ